MLADSCDCSAPMLRMICGDSDARCFSVCAEYDVCPRSPKTPMRRRVRVPTSGSVAKRHCWDLRGMSKRSVNSRMAGLEQ